MMGHSSGESAALAASGAVPATTPARARGASCASSTRSTSACWPKGKIADRRAARGRCAAGRGGRRRTSPRAAATSSSRWTTAPTSWCSTAPPDAIDALQERAARRRRDLPAAALRPRLPHAGLRRRQRRLPRLLRTIKLRRAARAALFLRVDRALSRARPRQCASSPPRSGRRRVRFRETIERMYADGVRLLRRGRPVGATSPPSSTTFSPARRSCAIASNLRRRNGVEQLLTVLAAALRERPAGARCDRCSPAGASPTIDLRAGAPTRVRYGVAARQHHADAALFGRATERAELRRLARRRALQRPRRRSPTPSRRVAATRSAPDAPTPSRSSTGGVRAAIRAPTSWPSYFDVMRGFLEQQRAVVESWQALARGPTRRRAAPRAPTLPLLDEIVEHDAQRLVARCHLEPAPTTSCAATCCRAGSRRSIPSCRAWPACR